MKMLHRLWLTDRFPSECWPSPSRPPPHSLYSLACLQCGLRRRSTCVLACHVRPGAGSSPLTPRRSAESRAAAAQTRSACLGRAGSRTRAANDETTVLARWQNIYFHTSHNKRGARLHHYSVPARPISEGAAPCPYWLAPCQIYTRPARIIKKKLI